MKKINNTVFLFSAIIVLLLSYSCDQEDNILGEDDFFLAAELVTNNVTDVLPIGVGSAIFSGDFVIKAPQNGKTIEKIDVTVSFEDLVNDGADLSKEAVFLESISPSTFTIGDDFRPTFSFETTTQDALTALNIALDDLEGADKLNFIFTTFYDSGSELSKTFSAVIICPPGAPPTSGTWEIELIESFGDGWNGASVVITIDGVSTEYTSNLREETFTFEVPNGASSLVISFSGGDFDSEVGFKITSASGGVVIDVPTRSFGDSPRNVEKEITVPINYCIY